MSDAEAHYERGLQLASERHTSDAIRELTAAIQARPEFGEAWFELCDVAGHINQHELSRFAGEQAVRFMPNFARAWLRYGIALSKLGRDEEAIAAYGQSLALDDKDAKAWINLAVACKSAGRVQEALLACHKAYAAQGVSIPDETNREVDESAYSLLDWHLALIELLLGDYRQGFGRFRARFAGTDWKRITADKPLWRGEPLKGKTILAISEFGYGDTLMMCRYLPLLKEQGARVVLRAPAALIPLFCGWNKIDDLYADDQQPPAFDYHTALFDLPYRFGTTLENIPVKVPYLPMLTVDEKTQLLSKKLPRVGIAWAGRAEHQNDRRRSLPLSIFAEILKTQNYEFFSFMHDPRPGDNELLVQYPVTDLGPRIRDFADSARFLNQMDLVITCDSALAHLAGGMGKPVWTLLPFAPDWRWLLEREDSPWYPTMRLFRQTKKDDWSEVVKSVKAELERL